MKTNETKSKPKTRLCRRCGKPFTVSKKHRLLCSEECCINNQREATLLYAKNHLAKISVMKRIHALGDFSLPPQYEFMRDDIISFIRSLPINFLKHRREHYIPAIVWFLMHEEYLIIPARHEIKNAFNLKRTKHVTKCYKDLRRYASADKTCVVCNKHISAGEGAMYHKKLMHHTCIPTYKKTESQ